MKFRNVESKNPRTLESSTPHFTFQIMDERRVLANMLSVLAARSPVRGIHYVRDFSDSGMFATLTTAKNATPVSGSTMEQTRIGMLLSTLGKSRSFTDPNKHPITAYYKTLKHTELFKVDDNRGGLTSGEMSDSIFDSALLSLIAEQPGIVVQFPISSFLLENFASYIDLQSMVDLDNDKWKPGQLPALIAGKMKGKFVSPTNFAASSDVQSSDVKVDVVKLFSSEAAQLLGASDSATVPGEDIFKKLVVLDSLLNVDQIVEAMKKAGQNLFSVKPEEKIGGLRKIVSLLMAMLAQPYLLYVQFILDVLNNPVMASFLNAKYPTIMSSNVVKDLNELMAKVRFTPVYAEMLRHYRVQTMTTAVGNGGALIIPSGIAHYFPFVSPSADTKGEKNSELKTGIKNEVLSSLEPTDQSFFYPLRPENDATLGVIDEGREQTLFGVLGHARSVITAHFLGEDGNATDYNEAMGVIGGAAAPAFRHVDRLNLPVLFTDGVLANQKMDYDTITEGLLVPQSELLKPSPTKKGLIVGDGNSGRATTLTHAIHSIGEVIPCHVLKRSGAGNTEILGSGLSLLSMPLDPWFERFSVNAKSLLNGRLPFSRYNADLDGTLVAHSSLANFASDIGLDPRMVRSLVQDNVSSYVLVFGPVTSKLVKEFFTLNEEPGSVPIPDAAAYDLPAKARFRYSHYFVSSRGRVSVNYMDFTVLPTIPSVQRIVYNDWGKSGIISLASTQNVLVDKAFESTSLDDSAVLANACHDLLSRLKV